MEQRHILIAEPSDVIRKGLRSILAAEEAPGVKITEINRAEALRDADREPCPDVVIVNPSFALLMPPAAIKKRFSNAQCVMLQVWPGECPTAHMWDRVISPWDSATEIRGQILGTGRDKTRASTCRHEPLSGREKDIVVCVVKGMTNMQIAEKLHLSHHTVGTHRRNISAKLDIHSTSGLTVYAISNNLVHLADL